MWTTIGELFQHNNGKQKTSSSQQGTLHRYITTSNVYWDRFDLSKIGKMFFSDSELDKYSACEGDLLVCEGGDIGRAAIWNYDYTICIQNHLHRLRAYVPICTRFFLYSLMDTKGKGLIRGKGIGLMSLSANDLHIIPTVLPPLTEQERIVAEIERWFRLIDVIEQGKSDLQSTIKQTKNKILDLAIHGKLVAQDPNDEPASELLKRINPKAQIPCDNEHSEKLPQGWCTCRLKDISIIITGSTPSKSNPNYYGGDVPFYKPADLDAGRFLEKSMEHVSEAGKKISRVVPMGSTAVCCIGSIGKVGYLTQEGITNQQINSAIPSEAVNSLFLYYTCASPSFYNELQLLSSAVTISIINKSKMENIKVSLPPLLEQKCIVKKIEELFTVLDTIEQSLQA